MIFAEKCSSHNHKVFGLILAYFVHRNVESPMMAKSIADERKVVLVIDDDADCRKVMSEVLRREGYSVIEANNGEAGIELLNHIGYLPAIILLDMAMPVLDGPGFLKWRENNRTIREVPVVITSGAEAPANQLNGVNAVLKKPVNVAPFLKIVSQYSNSH